MDVRRYGRFLATGAVVGVITVLCRELIGRGMPNDTAASYSASVVGAYAIGVVLSFLINRRFTFRHTDPRYWNRLPLFAAVAVVGLASTWFLSLGLRYGLRLQALLGGLSALVAFAAAALLSSIVTYSLTALLVFPQPSGVTQIPTEAPPADGARGSDE